MHSSGAFRQEERSLERRVRALIFVLALTVLLQEAKPPRFAAASVAVVEAGGPLFLQEYILVGLVCVALLTEGIQASIVPGSRNVRMLAVVMALWGVVVLLGTAFFGLPVADGAWGNVRMLAEGVAAFIVVAAVRWPATVAARLLFIFVCVMIFHSTVLWMDFISPGALPFETVIFDGGGDPRLSGLFLQPSRAGFMLAIALVFALAMTSRSGIDRWTRSICLLGLPILAGGILLTQTRGSILAVGAGAVYVLWRSRNYGWLFATCILGFVVAVSGATFKLDILRLGFERFSSTPRGGGTARSDVYARVWEFIATYPLGGGAGSLYDFSGAVQIPHAHNMYLQVAVMFGIPGLLLFLYWIRAVFRLTSWRSVSGDMGPRLAAWLGLRAALIVAMVAFMTEPFLITNVGLWFWVIAGILVSLAVSPQDDDDMRASGQLSGRDQPSFDIARN